jgi:hypothetical protein
MQLETINDELKIKYYSNIISACNKISLDCSSVMEHLNSLSKVVSENESSVTINDKSENKFFLSEKVDYLYLKPWSKLNTIHKIIKIKEFINTLDIKNETENNILKDKLIDLVKDKALSKKNKIVYDETKGNIISISYLIYENGKYDIVI